MDSEEELEERILLLVVAAVIENVKGRICKEPCRTSILTGHQYIMLQERFQHSGETISRYFNEVLRAIMELSKELIKPPSFSETPAEILNNSKYFPWFK
ncbi:hypothetical protein MKX03_003881, partial [Papaver bracteatum]